MIRRFFLLFALACAAASPPARAQAPAQDRLVVFAAVSLTEALTEAGTVYAKQGGAAPAFSFAASSTLARQIENGAPAGVFVSADEEWMDYLVERGLIDVGSRTALLGNALVLVVPRGQRLGVAIGPGFDLAGALKGRKLALADSTAVPAGRYAQAALTFLGAWRDAAPLVVRADNMRAALSFVERREAAAGIVYATDAALSAMVEVAGVFPAASHPPISYPGAVVARNDGPGARAFLGFLSSAPAKAVFRKYGFAEP
jgi:molybdate transport system substrate-binding protein